MMDSGVVFDFSPGGATVLSPGCNPDRCTREICNRFFLPIGAIQWAWWTVIIL
jgi:hypothetical protein